MSSTLKSRAEAELDRLARDPYCALYLPLWKMDGYSNIYSREAASKSFSIETTQWTPQGRSFSGGNKLYTYDDQGLDIEDAVTVELYLKHTSAPGASCYLLGKRYDTFCLLCNASRSVYFSVTTAGGTAEEYLNISCPLNRFALVSATYDSSDGKMRGYLDGQLTGVKTHDHGGKICIDHTGYIRVGNNLEGIIALALYYSRALAPPEIEHHSRVARRLFQ